MGILKKLLGGEFGGGHHGRRSSHGGHHGYRDQAPAALNGVGCPNCRTLNAQGARFCQQCGTSLAPNSCKQCNAQLQPGTKFCGQCGTAQT